MLVHPSGDSHVPVGQIETLKLGCSTNPIDLLYSLQAVLRHAAAPHTPLLPGLQSIGHRDSAIILAPTYTSAFLRSVAPRFRYLETASSTPAQGKHVAPR